MKKQLWITALALMSGFGSKAQENHIIPCGTDEHYFEHYLPSHPEGVRRLEDFMTQVEEYKKNPPLRKNSNVYKIPVVFHVIHEYGNENISKEQILDQIRALNEDFRRTNSDASNTRPVFLPVAADCEIEFVLAAKDPQGNCTDGINRIFSSQTNNANDNVKKLSYWPSDRYLNVWVVRTVESSGGDGTTTLGYAQFPWDRSSRPTTDGIVVRSDYVGTIGTAASSGNRGRVTTHEIGHWLGLYHTFQGGCGNSSWRETIEDTPPVAAASFGCNLSANTCTNDFPDLPDQVENYMDYTNGVCQNMFTQGQKSLMHQVLETYRTVLISEANATFTGVDAGPAACAPRADFSNKRQVACANNQLEFSDLSYGGNVVSRLWTFEGGTPATSTLSNPVVKYAGPGIYKVTLQVSNAAGSNVFSRDSIVVVQPEISSFQAPFTESMESAAFPPEGWLLESSTTGNFERISGTSYSGNASARILINRNTPNGALYSLITAPVNIEAINDPRLNFWAAYAQREGSLERLRVYASTNCGQNWVLIYLRAGTQLSTAPATASGFVPSSSEWASHQVSLNNFKGSKNLMIKFEIQSNSGNNVYLDDINIGSLTSVASYHPDELGMKLYPNPSADRALLEFTLSKGENTHVWISDLAGRKISTVFNGYAEEGMKRFELNTSSLLQGMYAVHVEAGDSRMVRQLMVIH
jgi:PKD repeat protein